MDTEDIEEDLRNMKSNFDFSNLEKTHPLFDENSKSKLFRFKEEMALKPILRYIGLASKVYCLQIACCHNQSKNCGCNYETDLSQKSLKYTEKLVCKGSSRFSLNNITFEDYLSCLERQETKYVTDFRIISKIKSLQPNLSRKRVFQDLAISGTYWIVVFILTLFQSSIAISVHLQNVENLSTDFK